ncbi:MAG TPA: hypothetical protein VF297_18660 [Pyrinomonadaceae bacterium]
MRVPVSFDDTWYFRREYRGDLVVTEGVLYYFPHTNAMLEKARRHAPDTADAVLPFLGPAGEAADLGLGLYKFAAQVWRKVRTPTINQPRLKKEGLWMVGASSRDLQARLDAHVEAARREPARLVAYELTLPKPMRFAAEDVKNARVRLGVLKFETEFDSHDFTVGLRRAGRLRHALRDGGFAV